MAVVRVIHWREEEATPLIEACRGAGFEVDYLASDGGTVCRAIRTKVPDVIAIDLSRRPSHGREVAIWLRTTKATRSVPILFVGGDALKVALIKELLPDAAYCEMSGLGRVIKRLSKSAATRELVTPPRMMERLRGKSAAQKLGIEAGTAVSVIDPPRDFPNLLGSVPEAVEFQEEEAPVTLWFVHDRAGLLDSLRRMRALATRTRLWLLWRKGGSGDGLTQNSLRETMRETGLVDYKICAVDERWSGMLFTRKKA